MVGGSFPDVVVAIPPAKAVGNKGKSRQNAFMASISRSGVKNKGFGCRRIGLWRRGQPLLRSDGSWADRVKVRIENLVTRPPPPQPPGPRGEAGAGSPVRTGEGKQPSPLFLKYFAKQVRGGLRGGVVGPTLKIEANLKILATRPPPSQPSPVRTGEGAVPLPSQGSPS
jgi:hypothetical protein